MVLYSYGPIHLCSYIVMVLCSDGLYSYGRIYSYGHIYSYGISGAVPDRYECRLDGQLLGPRRCVDHHVRQPGPIGGV